MKERMTRDKVNARARKLGLEAEVSRIWALADDELGLREHKQDRFTSSIPFRFVEPVPRGRKRTIFRIGYNPEEEHARLAISFPFYARWQHGPPTPGLRTLHGELLKAVGQSRLTLLDPGATEDLRIELREASVDILVQAIRTMYDEVSQNL